VRREALTIRVEVRRPSPSFLSQQGGEAGAWLTLAAITHSLLRAGGCLASPFHARARGATIRADLINLAARTARRGRGNLILHLPATGTAKPGGSPCSKPPVARPPPRPVEPRPGHHAINGGPGWETLGSGARVPQSLYEVPHTHRLLYAVQPSRRALGNEPYTGLPRQRTDAAARHHARPQRPGPGNQETRH
jgi:hypothetical protein